MAEAPEKSLDDLAREAVAIWMMSHGYVTGHGDTLDGLLRELVAQAREG